MARKTWPPVLFAVPTCLLLAACADPQEPANVLEPATLSITYEAEVKGSMYVEGALAYARVSGQGITQEEEIPFEQSVEIEVPGGGDYLIESWVRPCAGNCGALDGPTDRCDTSVVVPGGATMRVVIGGIVTEPCTIDVGSD